MNPRLARVASARGVVVLAALLALALTLPSLAGGLAQDDWLQRLAVRPDPRVPVDAAAPWDLFVFERGDLAGQRRRMDDGARPWWMVPGLRVAFLRPLSSLTHYLDYRLAPRLPALAHLHSLAWFALAVAAVARLYRRACPALTFTAPHYCSGGMIIAMDPAIRTGKDLAGKVVAVQTGTSYLENVQKVSSVKEVKNFPTDVDARSALNSRRVDAWVTDRFVAKAVVEKNPNAGFKLGDMLFIERIAAAVAKGNQPLADAWSQGLAAIQADGSYAELSKKYFNEDVRCN